MNSAVHVPRHATVRRRLRTAAQGAAGAAALGALAVSAAVVAAALCAAVMPAAARPGAGGQALLPLLGSTARIGAFTAVQALVSTAVAHTVGVPAAFFTARREFAGRKFLLSLAAVPMCIPSLIVALGYVSFFGVSGTFNAALRALFRTGGTGSFLYSFAGLVVAQGFYNFPLVMATVHSSWAHLPADEADAARMLGAGEARVFRTVTVHQLMPAVVSSCMLVFLYCFFSFMMVLLFGSVGCTTLEVEIYNAARGTLDFRRAAALAALETALACAFVALYALLERRAARLRGLSFAGGAARKPIRGAAERLGAAAVFVPVALLFLAPLASIAYNAVSSQRAAFAPGTLVRVVTMRGFPRALATTVATATATGTCATLAGFAYAVFVRTVDAGGRRLMLRVIPMLPMAVSSVVMGTGLTALVRHGNAALLVIAQTALTWPLAFRHIHALLEKIPAETVDAARLLSAHRLDTVFRLYVPASWRGIAGAAGFCFAVGAGDTTLPLVLALPHFDTLALFTYRLAGSYRFHEACAAGLVLGALCMAVFAAADHARSGKTGG